ncbi:MAG: DNA repair protein RecN, partial [Thermoguttaceae bacterium]|nr:DNA repair protein RecN [Thermoguttaceae bacterium]
LEERKKELDELDKGMDTAALEKALAALEKDYFDKAKAVSQKRTAAAKDLSDRVTAIMAELHMEGGRFEVSVTDAAPSKHGTDAVEFLVAGHAGTAPKALSKVASGGELSRISLAVSVIASRATETPTLIFDEVDSGVGGAVAEVVGRLLKTLSSDHQVLCVTHLPQVASQAASHFLVEKKTAEDTGKTVSGVTELEGDARVGEIARMLGGIEMTDATLAHAREMLGKKK